MLLFKALFWPDPTHEKFVDTVLLEYARAATKRLVEGKDARTVAALEQSGIARWIPSDPARLWAPELGHMNTLYRRDPINMGSAAAQFVLLKASLGAECDLAFPTAPGDTLYVAGRHLHTDGSVRIISANGRMRVLSTDGETTLEWRDGRWLRNGGRDACLYDSKSNVLALGGYCVDPHLALPDDDVVPHSVFEQACGEVFRGLDTIRLASTNYATWCARVLRQIHLVGSAQTVTLGRSSVGRPGAVLLSHPAELVQHAESLVHECTHQYFYLMTLLAPIKRDPTDDRLYYSSIVSRRRPIDRVLMAYHAAANMLMFLEQLIGCAPECAEAGSRRLKRAGEVCGQLLEVLVQNEDALSAQANAFWRFSEARVRESLERLSLRAA